MAGATNIVEGGQFIQMALLTMFAPIVSSFILMAIRYVEIKKKTEVKHVPKYTALLGIGSLAISFVTSVTMAIMYFFGEYGSNAEELTIVIGQMEMITGTNFHYGIMIDPLSVFMTMLLGVIGFLIHIYAYDYMSHHEPEVTRFYAFLNFFTGSMFGFILAGNLFMSFIWWEMLGVSSYFLIGYYWKLDSARKAGTKAFLYNKVGDVAFMLGIILVLILPQNTERTLDYHLLAELNIPVQSLVLPGIFLFGAAVGKSSQFPLFGWLPEAMEGPTPVSALLHSSTMVKAGLYLLLRNFTVFYEINHLEAVLPEVDIVNAATVVLWIGTLTALMGAAMAVVATDFKKILAFSTISQLGYIAMAIGAGGKAAGFYHLVSHATFKSLLFLSAGSVIHGTGGLKDIRDMGGLAKSMKITATATAVGLFGLSGFPLISSGFFSKDAVLLAVEVSEVPGAEVMYWIGVFTAFLTAFYSMRLFLEVFIGRTEDGKEKKPKIAEEEIHREKLSILNFPLIVLSTLVIIESLYWAFASYTGFNGFMTEEWFGEFLGVHGHPFELLSPGIAASITAVVLGYALGLYFYHYNPSARAGAKKALGWMGKVAEYRFGADLLISFISMNIFVKRVSPAFAAVDELVIDDYIIDTLITQQLGLGGAELSDTIDREYVDGAVNATWKFIAGFSKIFRKLQSGLTNQYALWMVFGAGLLFFFVNLMTTYGFWTV